MKFIYYLRRAIHHNALKQRLCGKYMQFDLSSAGQKSFINEVELCWVEDITKVNVPKKC